jgi:hypothetical protein
MIRSVHSLEESLLCRFYKEEAINHSPRELESLRIAKIRTVAPTTREILREIELYET